MVAEDIGRLIVVGHEAPHALLGILNRGDILSAHARRLKEAHQAGSHLSRIPAPGMRMAAAC